MGNRFLIFLNVLLRYIIGVFTGTFLGVVARVVIEWISSRQLYSVSDFIYTLRGELGFNAIILFICIFVYFSVCYFRKKPTSFMVAAVFNLGFIFSFFQSAIMLPVVSGPLSCYLDKIFVDWFGGNPDLLTDGSEVLLDLCILPIISFAVTIGFLKTRHGK